MLKNVFRIFCIMMCLVVFLGLAALGFYLGLLLADKTGMTELKWYQPSGGPDMGKWKQGPAGGGAVVWLAIMFAILGGILGGGLSYLISKCFKFFTDESL